MKIIFPCLCFVTFQLHHTGIKTVYEPRTPYLDAQFQLHHTGIKTNLGGFPGWAAAIFQLHHTGIKTR